MQLQPYFVWTGTEDPERGNGIVGKAKAGTAHFLVELENKRAIKVCSSTASYLFLTPLDTFYITSHISLSFQVFGKSTLIGLAITFLAGFCFSLFSPAFNLATNDQWHTLKKGVVKLVVYTAFFWFSISCFIIAIILNIIFLYRPVMDLPRSSFKAYLNDWNGRGWAFLAGLLCGFGNGLQFMGGQAAGYAAADAVQVSFNACKRPTDTALYVTTFISMHVVYFQLGSTYADQFLVFDARLFRL